MQWWPSRYLYQVREVRTNVLYSAYTYEQTNWHSSLFTGQLFDHFSNLSISLDQVKIQTDQFTNG